MNSSMQNPFADSHLLRQQARLAALRYRRRLPSATVGESHQSLLSDQPDVELLGGTHLPPGVHFEQGLGLIGTPAAAGSYVVEFEERPAGGVRRWLP